jgi:hypothetical protein
MFLFNFIFILVFIFRFIPMFTLMSAFVLSFTLTFIFSGARQESSSPCSYSGSAASSLPFFYVFTRIEQLKYNPVAKVLIQNPFPLSRHLSRPLVILRWLSLSPSVKWHKMETFIFREVPARLSLSGNLVSVARFFINWACFTFPSFCAHLPLFDATAIDAERRCASWGAEEGFGDLLFPFVHIPQNMPPAPTKYHALYPNSPAFPMYGKRLGLFREDKPPIATK